MIEDEERKHSKSYLDLLENCKRKLFDETSDEKNVGEIPPIDLDLESEKVTPKQIKQPQSSNTTSADLDGDFFLHPKDTVVENPGEPPGFFAKRFRKRNKSEPVEPKVYHTSKCSLTRHDIAENLTIQYQHFTKKAEYLLKKRSETADALISLSTLQTEINFIDLNSPVAHNALLGIKTKLSQATDKLLQLYTHWNDNQTRAIRQARNIQEDILKLSAETGAYLFRPDIKTRM